MMVGACDSKYSAIENAVYFGEAQTAASKTITVSDAGAVTDLYVSLARAAGNDVKVSIVADEAVLARYNSRNGTGYLPLPEKFYKLGNGQLVIEAGKYSSDIMRLDVLPFDETLDVSETYAIPVRIDSSEGADVLKSASEMVIICDKLIQTKTYHTNGGLGASGIVSRYTCTDEELEYLGEWTIEFLSYCESFGTNAHNFNIKGREAKVAGIFCRYGELDHPKDELQVKVFNVPYYGIARYEPKKWNHIAITCDGSIVKIYKNGVLDLTVDNPDPGAKLELGSLTLKQGNMGAMSEFRIWRTARSQSDISHNMWMVNPKSEGLVHYWKMNDGLGATKFKDSVESGFDMPITAKSGTWKDQVFPPEQ